MHFVLFIIGFSSIPLYCYTNFCMLWIFKSLKVTYLMLSSYQKFHVFLHGEDSLMKITEFWEHQFMFLHFILKALSFHICSVFVHWIVILFLILLWNYFLLLSISGKRIGIVKIFDFLFLTDLHVLRCFEHDFAIFTKCLSICV